MKLKYDPEANALYVRFSTGDVVESEEVSPGVILDYDEAGHILALELLQAREKLSPEVLTEAAE
ncbi:MULTISPECIES: DUF2283 domain-containing protein [unclassified Ancylobacter]|uniref:DUF2283 domain-containing protein n=1 Tax=unclassified Ancylobacter TaxID=2626613 RepID=UPI0022713379|nr:MULTISPECIES: DUF2283 domain-containing protein [unclassified Ancylobacter]WAC27252.1 DUF2283 domain-containing protein [Ancylobacter sp. SL191]WGD30413.1 DUF2283 domain-containing protein [Ancylobacter sp. WKF20]